MKTLATTDMGRHVASSSSMSRTRADLARLTQEMSSGQTSDPARVVKGDTRILDGLARVMSVNVAEQNRVATIQMRLEAQSEVLQSVTKELDDTANLLLRPELFATDDRLAPTSHRVFQAFEHVVGVLNTQFAGRALFSGSAVDQPALAPARDIISALVTEIPQGAHASEIDDIVAAWFAPGGGFDAFLPDATEQSRQAELSGGVTATITQPVGTAPLRQVLATLAKGGVLAQRHQDLSAQTQRDLLSGMANDLRSGAEATRKQTEAIGADIARSEMVLTRMKAQHFVAQSAFNDIMLVDPYETASLLQDRVARLDQILAITARLSRLSLSNYL